jgi:hypothetical protein
MAGACESRRPLHNSHPTPQALARAVLDAVERRDDAALRRLAITEEEFRNHVWPELPAARAERNMPMSYVWSDLHQKSEGGLRTILAEHGGERYQLIDVRFDGDSTDYAAYLVHRESVFVVRKGSDAPVDLRLCGSLVEKDGAWKVFSFVVDD